MTKLTLTFVKSEQRISAKTNKPFTSQSIRATEYGERYLSGFGSKETANWKVGDVVEVEVTESQKLDKNGKPYLNWSIVKAESPLVIRMNQLEFRLAKHDTQIKELIEYLKNGIKTKKEPLPQPNFSQDRTVEEIEHDNKILTEAEERTMSELESLDSMAEEAMSAEY